MNARRTLTVLLAVVAAAAVAQSPPPTSDDPLFAETLPIDIDTAGAAELAAWLRQLGLPDGGDRAARQQRLREHYGLPSPEEASVEDTGSEISVESARSARYRSDELGHTTLVLEGEVVVTAVDRDTGARHRIQADRITYHDERNSLTASGSVEYTMTTDDGSEVFRGESLSVDTERWEGIFYDGSSQVDQTMTEQAADQDVTFTYSGKAITRRADETVVMEQATVTSSDDPDDPDYRIEAERLWILAPEEWAVSNGFLHVGEVPVLYLPYFLRPGGRLLFHPAVGQRGREGLYLQTTTYLIGRRPADDGSLSFLQRNAGETGYADERRGLFLLPVRAEADAADADVLTLMVDLYSRLGIFGGVQGRFGGLSLFGGVAASRALVADARSGVGHTPYLRGADGELVSHWDTATILGARVPLRYGLETEVAFRGTLGSVQGSFELFSDPGFTTDFLSRAHDLPTGGLLGLPQGPLIPPPPRDRLEWRLGGDLSLHPLLATPALRTLTFPTLSASWLWGSRTEPPSAGVPSALDRLQAASPTRRFYYPETLTLPAVAAVASGSLFRWAADGGLLAAEVGYSLRPVVSVDHRFDDGPVATRDQVDLDILHTRVDTRANGQISYSVSALDRIVGLSGALVETASYQVHARQEDGIDPELAEQLTRSDRSRTSARLRLNNTLSLRPLRSVPAWSGSSLSYGQGLLLHDVRMDLDTGDPVVRGPAWDRDRVLTHRAGADAAFAVTGIRARVGAGVDLPPRPLAADGRVEADVGAFSMAVRGGVAEQAEGADAGQLKPTPIDGRGSVRINSSASVSQSFRLDEQQRLERLRTQANAYGVTGTVTAAVREPLDPFGDPLPDGRPGLRATQVAVGYRLDTGTIAFWKNRIRLDAGVQTQLAVDPEAFVRDNSLSFDLRLGVRIHRFLDLSFRSSSVNRHLYRYLPDTAEQAGDRWVNPIVDLARSFNFLNSEDRIASAFKLESLRIEALHRLGDWNLSLAYQGRPEQHVEYNPETDREERRIVWTPALSVEVRWLPVPELYSVFRIDRQGLDIEDR